jgi:hypothetical protein
MKTKIEKMSDDSCSTSLCTQLVGLSIAFSTDSFDYFLNNNNFITQQGTLLEKYVFISASHHSRKRMISVDINLYLFLNTWGY